MMKTRKLKWLCCGAAIRKGERSCIACSNAREEGKFAVLAAVQGAPVPVVRAGRGWEAGGLKATNGSRAATFEKRLVDDINHKTGWWQKVYDLFASREVSVGGSKKLVRAELRGGCGHHHDLLLVFSDGSEEKCEVKQSQSQSQSQSTSKKSMDSMKTPWEHAGQYLNGTGAAWRIREWYARQWYDEMLPWSKSMFAVDSEIPDFDTWFTRDMSCGDAKTDFGKELKMKIKGLGKKAGSGVMKEKKAQFVKSLDVPREVKEQLYEDYMRATREVLADKDCWLSFNNHECRLWDNIHNDDFEMDAMTRDEKSVDLVWSYINPVDSVKRHIRVRFQNRIGVANLSVQCT